MECARVYQFSFVPVGFVAHLITRMIQQFKDSQVIALWRNGIIMKKTAGSIEKVFIDIFTITFYFLECYIKM